MSEAGPAPFGRLLRDFRLAAGLSQEGLAQRAQMSAGGLSRADAMMSFQADALGAVLERRKEVEATALGAAILAAKAAGVVDADKMADARVEKTFSPSSSETARAQPGGQGFVATRPQP